MRRGLPAQRPVGGPRAPGRRTNHKRTQYSRPSLFVKVLRTYKMSQVRYNNVKNSRKFAYEAGICHKFYSKTLVTADV